MVTHELGKTGDPLAPSKEKLEIKRFSQEQKDALKKQGYIIYELTGQSIKTLRDIIGRKFSSIWHKDFPDFEALCSMQSEVAINPSMLFLPESNHLTLDQQREMVNKFSEELGKTVKGVKAIIGQVADYAELASQHLKATEEKGKAEYLFEAKDKYGRCDRTRTETKTEYSDVANVGNNSETDGLEINDSRQDSGFDDVHVTPLVVPV